MLVSLVWYELVDDMDLDQIHRNELKLKFLV